MRNLIHARDIEERTTERIPRQVRPLTERQFTRHIREAGKRQTTLTLRVARAMKAQEVTAQCEPTA